MLFTYASFTAATSFSRGAEIFPLVLGLSGLILCLIQLVLNLYARSRSLPEEPEQFVDVLQDSSISFDKALQGAGKMLIWILGLYLAILVVGFKIAFVAFFISYLKKEAHAKWRTTIILTVIASYAILVHFEKLMAVHWPTCLLSKWVDIRWLLG